MKLRTDSENSGHFFCCTLVRRFRPILFFQTVGSRRAEGFQPLRTGADHRFRSICN